MPTTNPRTVVYESVREFAHEFFHDLDYMEPQMIDFISTYVEWEESRREVPHTTLSDNSEHVAICATETTFQLSLCVYMENHCMICLITPFDAQAGVKRERDHIESFPEGKRICPL
jgi:hypothetical protein